MHGDHVDALVRTAPDGIAFDGLRVDSAEGGFRFSTPDRDADGLTEAELREVAEGSPSVTNWYFWHSVAPQTDSRWAFLRWLENADEQPFEARSDALADGITTEWGQLLVSVTLTEEGYRRYDLRNSTDEATDVDELTEYEDPLDARDLAKRDDDGRYRPLKTAPTLRSGWRFPDLGPDSLVEAVDTFYPATVANWHREREGALDISHWHETIERQTGIYGVVKTWDRQDGYEHVNWVAEACCEDSQCVKRREWQYDDDTALDIDGGDGEFPCREPCSVVISAARKWTTLEGEQPKTYEFELTPSEKEQVEVLIDAVADGRIDDIREADLKNAANRYRVRYLRAKRFDEEGALSGTPTDTE
jgi:hypothetical protein